jgi:acyl carrier protein
VNSDSLVRDVLRELEFDLSGVDGATRLRDDLGVDSTELVEIGVAIERSTTLKIDTNEILRLKTIGDLVAYVDSAPRRG